MLSELSTPDLELLLEAYRIARGRFHRRYLFGSGKPDKAIVVKIQRCDEIITKSEEILKCREKE